MKLYRQKEQLKKDILKKRIVLEKELQIEIQKELVTELANRATQETDTKKSTITADGESDANAKTPSSPSKKR